MGPRIQARSALDVARVMSEVPVVYLVFDLVALNGLDLSELSVVARKSLLMELIRGRGMVRAWTTWRGAVAELFELCKQQELEGVVAKKKQSRYQPGPRRSGDWVKVKCERDDEFVIVGYLPGKGSRGRLGAIVVASTAARSWCFRGRVGSGFDERTLSDVMRMLDARAVDEPPIARRCPRKRPRSTGCARSSWPACATWASPTKPGCARRVPRSAQRPRAGPMHGGAA
jgi:bifunctional non-homologous end joining protein LigD